LNPQPSEPQSDALPIELLPPQITIIATAAGARVGIEPVIAEANRCATQEQMLDAADAHVAEAHGAEA
jgi:hypothetical protein